LASTDAVQPVPVPVPEAPPPTGDTALTIPGFHGRTERTLRLLEDALDGLRAVDPPGARSAAAVVQRMHTWI
jgi:hypothetical protein